PNQPSAPASCDSDGGAPKDDGGPCDLPICSPPCCALPGYAQDRTNYVVDPAVAQMQVGWYLGNKGVSTTLPIGATYRRIWGTTQTEALSLGLPADPVPGQLQISPGSVYVGPVGTPPVEVQAYLQPGCYERTLQPYAPFATAFPPDIQALHLLTVPSRTVDNVIQKFDTTKYQTANPNGDFPTFQITRANGLNGWTAYLRDPITRRLFSNVAALSGSF